MRLIVGLTLLGTSIASSAGTMTCNGTVFTSDNRFGATKGEVLDACGEPNENGFLNWVYQKDGNTYRLTFTASGLLTRIQSRPTIGD